MIYLDKYPALKHFLKKYLLPKYLWLRSLKYAGNTVYCPCCKGSFSKFIKVGPKREPMLCPKCRSNDRDRFFFGCFLKRTLIFLSRVSNYYISVLKRSTIIGSGKFQMWITLPVINLFCSLAAPIRLTRFTWISPICRNSLIILLILSFVHMYSSILMRTKKH